MNKLIKIGLLALAFCMPTHPPSAVAQEASPSPTPTIPDKEAVFDQKIIDTALHEAGVTKQVQYESPRVKEYVETTDQEADEYYNDGWCNAFVSWVMKKNGYEFASLNSLDQIGYFYHQVAEPKVGDVVLLSGHITLYFGKATLPGFDGAILILGGNQAHAVNVLPIQSSLVQGYYEPIKAPPGWTPSRHLSNSSMNSYNRIDDNGYIKTILEKAVAIPTY